jgi:exodeoxyribonuclease V beta subunit
VDEFQDTDPVQYDVFQLLFGETQATHPLVFVGDPKQAIYGFRGGDVFTYYGAKEIIRTGEHVPGEARHELDTNFRAEKGLVAAVNELFQDPMSADPAGPPARTSTFLNANIAYDGRLKAHDVTEDRRLTAGGQPAGKPFRIRTYPFTGSRLPGKHSPLAQQMYADVAREIVRLLSDKTLTIGSRHVAPQDIAVLVLDHEEATDIQQELLVRGVNAIRQATGCVFDTDEAIGLAHVMGAMLHPRQPRGVRAALCQPIMPCRDEDIRRFNDETAAAVPGPPDNPAKSEPESDESEPDSEESDEDVARSPKTLDEWMDVLAEAGRRWERRSFIEAFRFLAGRLGLRAHVAGLPDGARRLADLLHLAELAHVSARERQLGPNALWRWFVRQLDPDTREGGEDDAYKTRLASDEPAVRIMTIFKSKGLEFPIVFAPTLWRRQTRNRPGRTSHWQYHDADMRMLISLDPDDADAKNKARQEELEENIRLVYVALTRAINRTYVWALENSASRTSACALDHVLASWKARVPAETQSAHIEVMPADQVSWEGIPERWEPATTPKSLKEPQPPSVDKTHGHASYSSLAVHPKKKKFRIPDDSARDRDNLVVEAQTPEPAEPLPASGIFAIPGNATTGDCWHSIFENLDFQAGPEAMAKVIDDNLDRFRICKGPTPETVADKRRAVHDMVARVLTADLDAGYGRFALRDVPLATRRSELAFHFTMKQRGEAQKLQTLGCILDKHWNTGARDEEFLKNLSMSKKRLPLGFMVGSIDLLFQHDGRFYVVDWKSNWIKGRIENFEPPGLKAEMAANSYYLQYMIYTVAVDGFLQRALAGYDYEKHFGGIFYLFLRGVDARGRGIFTDRPSPKLIRALARFLAQGSGGAL